MGSRRALTAASAAVCSSGVRGSAWRTRARIASRALTAGSAVGAPLAHEGRALRRRQVAGAGPAAGQRRPAQAPAAAEQPQAARGHAGGQAVERRPAGEEAPQAEPVAGGGRRELAAELLLAPMPHQLRQRDADRADLLAAAAEGRGVGQGPALLDPDELRRQHRAHRARDRPSHRRGRRWRYRPGSGSCRRRSGCSAASRAARRPASACGRCRAARRGSDPGPSRSPGRFGPVITVV